MPKRTSAASLPAVRVVIVTLDKHLSSTANRAAVRLREHVPGLALSVHAAADFSGGGPALDACLADIASADILVPSMLFMDAHIGPVLPALEARSAACDAVVGLMSAGEVMRLTRMGGFSMNGKQSGPMALLRKLRGAKKDASTSSGASQLKMLRRIPRFLRFIPGTAQDVRAYFLAMQCWIAGSEDNLYNLVALLVNRYADGPRKSLRGALPDRTPQDYPDVGVYHPGSGTPISTRLARANGKPQGTVGLLLMRSYVLAGNTHHYDSVISALESRNLRVLPVFASGLDSRPAVAAYFKNGQKTTVDCVVSLTGFSLVGGPAYNDAAAAETMLADLDVPYIAAHASEFQSLSEWQNSPRGLTPVESALMVAIPELDGATGPLLFAGHQDHQDRQSGGDMQPAMERVNALAQRVQRLVSLRNRARAERRLGIVLFNFPPNAGATGSAAFLNVFSSLFNTLKRLSKEGYDVEVPASVEALRERVLQGNAARYGTEANVHHLIPTDEHVRRETWLREIEAQWGPAPGKQFTNGSAVFVLGAQFGKVFVGIQPPFGIEGDPMRLLFEGSFSPTHAFSAFYRYLKEDFAADAVLHFGTHGALEFMPGKQVGMSGDCWPERLIGALPNFYLYAANNPSEGALAKRRAAATLISYLTPTVTQAGLYRSLQELKGTLQRWRETDPASAEGIDLAELIHLQASTIDLVPETPWTGTEATAAIEHLQTQMLEYEYALIPYGLHVLGEPPPANERIDLLLASCAAQAQSAPPREAVVALVEGASVEQALTLCPADVRGQLRPLLCELAEIDRRLSGDHELPGLIHALDGGFIRPAPGGDVLRNAETLPTGRNIHGFDPFRLPSSYAVRSGTAQASLLLGRYLEDGNPLPESIALVLWGTDNLKNEGTPIAQALALMGAAPRFDSYGRLSGARLLPLEELGRPRVDVLVTLSGIFRDLLPLQTRLLAEAALLASQADEPLSQNFIRKHSLAYQAQHGCDIETAALRVFSNADGAYGANVNQLIDSGSWGEDSELAETYSQRKCFAYGCDGIARRESELLNSALGDVDLAYQNLESVELGITSIDHYFDTLGGISSAIRRARGTTVPVYIGDQTQGEAKVRTLAEQVALETRTRMLNPKWFESLLDQGYEGVRNIEAAVTNTLGWSATTGQVSPWVYKQLTQTFVLDKAMRERLTELNPVASARMTNRLIEAYERNYWSPDADLLQALNEAGDEIEDRLEGITRGVAACAV